MRRISVKEPVVFNNYGINIKTKNVFCKFDHSKDPVYEIKFTITRNGLGKFLLNAPDKIPVLDNALKTFLFYASRRVTYTLEEIEKSFEKLVINKCPLNGDPIIMTSFKGSLKNLLTKKELDNELLVLILNNYVSVENKDSIKGLKEKEYNLNATLRVDLKRIKNDLGASSFSYNPNKAYLVDAMEDFITKDTYLHRNFKTKNHEIVPISAKSELIKRDKKGRSLVKETLTFILHYLYMPGVDLYSIVEAVMNYRDRILLELSKHKLSLREEKLVNLENNNYQSNGNDNINTKEITDSFTSRGILIYARDPLNLTCNIFENNEYEAKSQGLC